MSNTYIPATWVGAVIIAVSVYSLFLIAVVCFLKRQNGQLRKCCEQYKASVHINRKSMEPLRESLRKQDITIQNYRESEVRHIAQIEAAETRLVKEIAKQKALNHRIEELERDLRECHYPEETLTAEERVRFGVSH